MTTEEMIYSKAIATYGKTLQSIVAIEECSELQKEISKLLRGKGDKEHLTEEITDVLICIEQLQMMYDISLIDILKVKKQKIERLLKNLEKEK